MASIAERLWSMGTTLGQQAANTISNQDRLIEQFQDDTVTLRANIEMERAAHRGTLAQYDMAQKQIESLSSEVAACQERIDTLESAASVVEPEDDGADVADEEDLSGFCRAKRRRILAKRAQPVAA